MQTPQGWTYLATYQDPESYAQAIKDKWLTEHPSGDFTVRQNDSGSFNLYLISTAQPA